MQRTSKSPKVFLLILCISSALSSTVAQSPAPLLDREVFFGSPETSGAKISPDGRHLAFLKSWHGIQNIWIKPIDEPTSAATLLTAENEHSIGSYLWSEDGKYIIFTKDRGDGNVNLFVVTASSGVTPGSDPPPARDLTNLEGVDIGFYASPIDTPNTVYIGLNDRDKAWPDLYRLELSSGRRTLIHKNTDRIIGWFFDPNGKLRVAVRLTESGDREILRVDPNGYRTIYSSNVLNKCWPLRISKDGEHVYLWTNKGANLVSLVLLNLKTRETQTVATDPLKRVEPGPFLFSERTGKLAMASYRDDRLRYYFSDRRFEADFHWLQAKLPKDEIDISSRSLDERWWLVTASSDIEPGETYLFDRKLRKLELQYRVLEKIPRESLAEMKTVHYKSSDGLDIPAYLTLPRGISAKGLPTIILPHGGPWGRDEWGFNAWAQFFANRGYAVLQPNFRGSAGFGQRFESAGYGQFGRKMQDDLTWGVKYLVAKGIADRKRIAIAGLSYGGYATLAGITFTPDLYAAAVDISGFCDLLKQQENVPAAFEMIRQLKYRQMGDPTTKEGKALLHAESPINFADRIRTPLLVVHGAKDPIVQLSQAERIVVAARDHGSAVEYLLAPDEGHGFSNPVNSMAMFMAIEKFLAAHIGGRYQSGAPEEVQRRLSEITVDPKSLKPN